MRVFGMNTYKCPVHPDELSLKLFIIECLCRCVASMPIKHIGHACKAQFIRNNSALLCVSDLELLYVLFTLVRARVDEVNALCTPTTNSKQLK